MSNQATSPQSCDNSTEASASVKSLSASAYLTVAPFTTAFVADLKRSLKLNLIDLLRTETGLVTLRPCRLLLISFSPREGENVRRAWTGRRTASHAFDTDARPL